MQPNVYTVQLQIEIPIPVAMFSFAILFKHTHTHTHNCFTAVLDFVQDYLGEPAPER